MSNTVILQIWVNKETEKMEHMVKILKHWLSIRNEI